MVPGFSAAKIVASSKPEKTTKKNMTLRTISDHPEARPADGAAVLRIVIQMRPNRRSVLIVLILDRQMPVPVNSVAQLFTGLEMGNIFSG